MLKCLGREGRIMIIETISNNKNYLRKIESMGKGLALFKVEVVDKKIGQNYHLFYADNLKPPMDIAINPCDGTIEYVSYFAQDEVIERKSIKLPIITNGMGVRITHKDFNENNVHITEKGEFLFSMSKNDLWILKKDIDKTILKEYDLGESNGLLFFDNEFGGMVLKNLSEEEIQEIVNSKCLL